MDVDLGDSKISAIDITKTLLDKGFWAFSDSAPVKEKLDIGDRILFYVGGKNRHYFIAYGVVKSKVGLANKEQEAILDNLSIGFFNKTIAVEKVHWFTEPIELIPLKNELSFIADKKNYGLSLRLPVREIPKEDFNKIVSVSD